MTEKIRRERNLVVDVIIPVYKPDEKFFRLLYRLKGQTFPVNKIIVINTEKKYWNQSETEKFHNLEVHHVSREEFDHGATRNMGARYSRGDIMVFMTDDAVPKGRRLVEQLVKALSLKGPGGETVAMAYGRQMPDKDCQIVEQYIRSFNYPCEGCIKTEADLPKLGIKTYFASNVCCAYRKDIFEKLGGFVKSTIFNEDMIFGAAAIKAGYAVAYAADARVIHSHNLTAMQQFRRNFDLAVSQADHPEVFEGLPSEGEGLRMIGTVAKKLLRRGRAEQLPALVVGSGCKYAGYRLGKSYRRLPGRLVKWCSSAPFYWDHVRIERNRL
ncbi:MAG: glycosyltransferase family 2 protein [Lachnospiraceae bacterium]|jgi:rhamnosyltransferase|nr:glycosyltransferase family 2 protein [Lachnospiraceae bacterium]